MSDETLEPQLSSRVRLHDWYAMSDDDRAVAVLHAWRHHQQPAREDEFRYVDAPELVALSPRDAAHHALHVTGGWHGLEERLDQDERDRLYHRGLQLEADRHPGRGAPG